MKEKKDTLQETCSDKIPDTADARKKIRLIGLDLDSTTLTTDKKLSPHTREVLEACMAQGIYVVPSTGRVLAGIPDELKELAGMTYIMTSNGASVHSLKTGEEIYQNGIPWERALELFDLVETYDTFYDFYAQGHGYCESRFYDQIPHYAGSPEILNLLYGTRTKIDDMREWVKTHQVPLEKISMFFETTEQRDAALADLRRLEDVVPTYSLFNNIELNARTCSKGEALLGLGARLGITPEEIMACGDSGNDLEMIRRAGVGVAMENATEEIKAAADFITKTNDEDGVAYAIEQFCDLTENK